MDETLQCVGAAFAGVGAGIGGRKWSYRTGRGRKVGAKVAGADEKGSEKGSEEVVGEEKDKDEGKGKEEAIEDKGNNKKKQKGAGDEGDERKPDLYSTLTHLDITDLTNKNKFKILVTAMPPSPPSTQTTPSPQTTQTQT